MKQTKFTHRHLARILIEAETPIAIGNGEKGILSDSLVVTDINGLPYIPGTSLTGVLRHMIDNEAVSSDIFGYQKKNSGAGSKLIITDAIMIGEEGLPMDGVRRIDFNNPFYKHFKQMPIRQHVRMTEFGTAADKGKFDGQVAYKGLRFVFEIELYSTFEKDNNFSSILDLLQDKGFRLGGGTRNGYGKFAVKKIETRSLHLNETSDMEAYLSKSSSLGCDWGGYSTYKLSADEKGSAWETFHIELVPTDFFLFGSGFSDDEADMTPVVEDFVEWKDGRPYFVEGTLLPATSIKGALSHRTAFYWNKLNNRFADDSNGLTGGNNPAVAALFGTSGEEVDDGRISRGNVLIDDVIIPKLDSKLVNHVAIDRFTGGALDGALFTEKVVYGKDLNVCFDISVCKKAFDDDMTIREAFELALKDLKEGMLPLGGGTNRGNGTFLSHLTPKTDNL